MGRFFGGIFGSPLSLVLFLEVIPIFVSQTAPVRRGRARVFDKKET